MARTSKQDFQHFTKACKYWIDRFALQNWEVAYEHAKLAPHNEAECGINRLSRRVTLRLNSAPEYSPSKKELEAAAFHEVAHLLFARLDSLAESRYIFPTDVEEEVHDIITRLTNAFILG